MLLFAERQFDHAVIIEIAGVDQGLVVADCHIVELDGAALHVTAGFTVGAGQTSLNEQRQEADAGLKLG